MTTRAKTADEGYALSRHQGLDHPRVAGRLLHHLRSHRRAPTRGLSCFLVPGDAPGLSFGAPEHKMGLTSSPTTSLYFDTVPVAEDAGSASRATACGSRSPRWTPVGSGSPRAPPGWLRRRSIARSAYAKEREQFGRPIAEFQGMEFLLAEMAAAVDTARASYLMAARKRDAGRPFTRDAAVAKMMATDTAMRVTTDAVQVLGGYGYTRDFPAERYMREAKVTQIFEGTNQIQRLVIARQLLRVGLDAAHGERRRPGQRRRLRAGCRDGRRPWWPPERGRWSWTCRLAGEQVERSRRAGPVRRRRRTRRDRGAGGGRGGRRARHAAGRGQLRRGRHARPGGRQARRAAAGGRSAG